MAKADQKLSDIEKGGSEQETAFNSPDTDEAVRFIPTASAGDGQSGSPNGAVDGPESNQIAEEFYGLTREELEKYASDPKWVKVRWILFAIFVVCWAAMLIAAIIIVVLTPKCPAIPELSWFQTNVAYKLDVEKFQDSNGDAVGDIAGIKSRLSYFVDLNVKSIWLSENIMDSAKPTKAAAKYGTLEDLTMMTKEFKKKGIRLLMDVGDVSSLDNNTAEALVRSWADAGVEAFVVSQSSGSSNQSVSSLITRWQQILDEEYNDQDDRDRVVIADSSEADSVKLTAVVYKPPVLQNCTNGVLDANTCGKMKLTSSESVTTEGAPWKIAQVDTWKSALVDLVLKLTQAGTPNVIYGDDIGLTGSVDVRPYMYWDDSPQGGFTDKEGFTPDVDPSVGSVMAQSAVGYNKMSYYNLFKKLASVRASEQSLRWGKVIPLEAEEAVVFHREAELFPPVLVAVNGNGAGFAANFGYGEYTQGKILVSTSDELVVGESYDMSAVYLQPGGVVVARLSKPVKE